MQRTYDLARRVVKGMEAYLERVPRLSVGPLGSLFLLMLASAPCGYAQGLPAFAPLNPVATSRSGVYFQPIREPTPGRWNTSMALDYASVIEYEHSPLKNYVLDSEILRLVLGLSRDLGQQTFVELSAGLEGAYAGFLDGFLDWYHGALGIRVSEREQRPKDQFLYSVTLPDGRSVSRGRSDLFLGDMRVALGFRYNSRTQTVLSLTLPTSTGPAGYGKGVPSVALLNTLRSPLNESLVYEGSVGFGLTPEHGAFADLQHQTFVAVSSGLRYRIWGSQALFANLFYHSPYYHGTSLRALDRRELSLDFGWILRRRNGAEWRVGLTEDLEPGGPGVDLVLRVGRTF